MNISTSITTAIYSYFDDCINLFLINILIFVLSINNDYFYDYINLSSIIISTSIITVIYSCFNDCSSLSSINIQSILNPVSLSIKNTIGTSTEARYYYINN